MASLINSLAEGGQTWAHRVRMLRQVLKIVFFTSLFVFSLTLFLNVFWGNTDQISSLYYHLKAHLFSIFGKKMSVNPQFWKQVSGVSYGGKEVSISIQRVLQTTTPLVNQLYTKFLESIILGIKVSLASFLSFVVYFFFRGLNSKGKKHISGSRTTSSFFLRLRLFILRRASKVKIGSLPYVKNSETLHTLITGGTGSGKTNCLHHILSSIQKNGSKTVIVDTTGSFVSRYYREKKDVILNPFDERGVDWSPWAECLNKFEYEEMAESFIPISNNDNEGYWRAAAQCLFSSLLQKLDRSKKITDLVKWSLYSPLRGLSEFVEGTKAASHIDINSEKTAGSIRSVASSYLGCLEYLDDCKNPFSIKKWIKEESDSRLFICCKPSQRSSIAPLISSWISIAVRGVMDLETSRNRRIWFVLDELPTLNKVKGLETLLTEGRKYGACAILALQSPAQLEEIYGRNISQIIAGNCATKIVFSENDPQVAERISRIFGTCEVGEYNEGISYGAHEMRDGVNLSFQKKKEATVSANEIQSLENNRAFVRLSGKYPIAKIKLKIAK